MQKRLWLLYAQVGANVVCAAMALTFAASGVCALCSGAPVVPPAISKFEQPQHGLSLSCQVVGVVDGDTIEVEIVRRVRVRLLDCWAPELRTTDAAERKVGLAAKLNMAAIAIGKQCTLFVPTADGSRLGDVWTFDRVLGHVWLAGDRETLGTRQVKAGHASTTKGGVIGEWSVVRSP